MNDNQLTGNIGLFYACYRLSLLGWNVLPTIRNAKGADIFLVKDERKLGIQVKTLSAEADVALGENYNDPSVDFWIVLMNIRKGDQPKVYIISQKDIIHGVEVCKHGNNSEKNLIYQDIPKSDGKIKYWLNKKFLTNKKHDYAEAWGSIA